MRQNWMSLSIRWVTIVFWCGFAISARAQNGKPPAGVVDASKFPNLQAAIDALPESGGLVQLPPGDFRLTEPVVVARGEIRIEGAGAATKLINANQSGKPALHIRPADRETNRRARIWRVQLANFRIIGDPNAVDAKSSAPKPKSGDGVLAEGVNEIYIHGLSVDHNGGNGVHLIDCYEDPRIADSIFTYNAQAGLHVQAGHDIVVSANHFEENQDALRCFDSFNLCMSGNNLDDHLGNGVVIENTYGSVVSGNMIEECHGIAIIMDRDCYGNTVSANVIAHNSSGGVDLRDAWGCAVSANTFVLDGKMGVKIGPNSGRIALTGNAFSNSHIGDKQRRLNEQDDAHGIQLVGTSDVTITGNVFTGLKSRAVRSEGACRRILVTSNVVADITVSGSRAATPIDLGDAEDSKTEGNIIDH